jgi:hypothetical protein
VGSYALEKGEGVADAVRCGSGELGGVEEGVDRDDLLKQRSHHT